MFGVRTLSNAANLSDVPTEVAAEHNKDEVLEGKFHNLHFSPFSKKTSFDFFFPFIDIRFFLKFKTSTLSNNPVAK